MSCFPGPHTIENIAGCHLLSVWHGVYCKINAYRDISRILFAVIQLQRTESIFSYPRNKSKEKQERCVEVKVMVDYVVKLNAESDARIYIGSSRRVCKEMLPTVKGIFK